MRKSVYWVFGLGLIVAAAVGRPGEINEDRSVSGYWHDLVSPFAGIILALLLRFGSSLAALALAYPLARSHETGLEPRANFGKSIGAWFDRLHVARAYRSLRWTHHVRQAEIARLGKTGARLSRVDPILDVANITLVVAGLVTLVAVGGR